MCQLLPTKKTPRRAQPPFPPPRHPMRGHLAALMVCLALAGVADAAGTNADGLKFLEEKKGKEGVVSLPSGLMYKVLRKGKGKHHPKVDSECECHYEGARRVRQTPRPRPTRGRPARALQRRLARPRHAAQRASEREREGEGERSFLVTVHALPAQVR